MVDTTINKQKINKNKQLKINNYGTMEKGSCIRK